MFEITSAVALEVPSCRNSVVVRGLKLARVWSLVPGIATIMARSQPPLLTLLMTQDPYLEAAIEQANKSLAEGGIPIGSVLVHEQKIIGRGHNCRVQTGSPIDHGEMNCLRNAGRLSAKIYRKSTLYSTLSPCPMCSGAIVLYKIPRVIVGENQTYLGAEDYLRSNGIEVEILQNSECIRLMQNFIRSNPELWNEDIGV
jgi:creatinine deaminase